MGRMSVATIDAPEFINVESVNPLISKCEIKVLYLGKNRNKSYIDKSAATAIGKTLPGSPIVGYYKKNNQDFSDHGQQIIVDDEGIKINDLTRPYGFVPTNAEVWFQKFIDTDALGNEVVREYLMTVGYLWTGQYEEVQRVYESQDGNPQSMKLHDETLKGNWTKDIKSGTDFFIINDAIIQNLCILGENVEPCFEGADITEQKISSSFSKNNNFVTTLFSMMQELNELLNNEKGGNLMEKENVNVEDTTTTNFSENEDKVDKTDIVENQVITEEFAKASEEEEDNKDKKESDSEQKQDEEDKKAKAKDSFAKEKEEEEDKAKEKENTSKDEEKEEDEEPKKKFELLEQQYAELQTNYSSLQAEYNKLLEFKNAIEDEKKDAMINQFYMLSDEDKKDVIDNKSKYSLEDIEAKLSIICVRKKVNFGLDSDKETVEGTAPVTYNLNETVTSNLPAWLKAVEATKLKNQ